MKLEPPAGLYDGVYSDELKGRWWRPVLHFWAIVEGPGSRPGTVAVHAEHNPDNRQDDLPIQSLLKFYLPMRDVSGDDHS